MKIKQTKNGWIVTLSGRISGLQKVKVKPTHNLLLEGELTEEKGDRIIQSAKHILDMKLLKKYLK